MSELFYFVFVWILIWFSGWGVFFFLRMKKPDLLDNIFFRPTYFLILVLLIISYFRDIFLNLIKDFTIIPFVVLIVVILLEILLYYICHKYLKTPKVLKESFSNLIFLHMDYKYIFYKFFDLMFQQVVIIVLIFSIMNKFVNNLNFLIFLIILFSAIHLPLLKFFGKKVGVFFVGMSIVGIIIFYNLILKVNYGFVYSYIVHWVFYTCLGVFFWLYNLKLRNRY